VAHHRHHILGPNPSSQALAAKDALAARLSALQLAHTEVELAAKLALDDVAAGAASTVAGAAASKDGVVLASSPPDAPGLIDQERQQQHRSMAGAVPNSVGSGDDRSMLQAMLVARRQLERVRQLASDALSAADRRVSEAAELKRSATVAAVRDGAARNGGK
jgi:hypothetical protein